MLTTVKRLSLLSHEYWTLSFPQLAPNKFKRSTVQALVHRAYTHSSSWTIFHTEVTELRKRLLKNGYPIHYIDNIIGIYLNNCTKNKSKDSNSEFSNPFPLQFRGPHSLIFASKLRKLVPDISIYFTTYKLRSIFSGLTNYYNVPLIYNSNVVYSYKCVSCDSQYIGETKRHLSKRISEHRKGPLYEHHVACKNTISFTDCFTIIDRHNFTFDRLVLEALYIHKHSPSLNTQHMHSRSNLILSSRFYS